VGVSSLIDTWLLLRNMESGGERNRALYVLKSRGMAHSNQVREFVLSDQGISLLEVYSGAGNVLTGSARRVQEAQDKAEAIERQQGIERRRRTIERERSLAEAQVASINHSLQARIDELNKEIEQETLAEAQRSRSRGEIAARRGVRHR
jgi:circadian clock protein KaiC